MTYDELEIINSRRRAQGKPELSMTEARAKLATQPDRYAPGFDTIGFLIGLTTGVPVGPRGVTGEAILGMALHQTPAAAEPSGNDISSSSYDNSSSSYDSGGSSSGGDFSGGGSAP